MLLSQDHTSLGGILALTVCVTAAAGYQQAPLRGAAKAGAEEGMPQEVPDVPSAEADGEDGEEEEQEPDGHHRGSSGSGVSIEMQGRANRV